MQCRSKNVRIGDLFRLRHSYGMDLVKGSEFLVIQMQPYVTMRNPLTGVIEPFMPLDTYNWERV